MYGAHTGRTATELGSIPSQHARKPFLSGALLRGSRRMAQMPVTAGNYRQFYGAWGRRSAHDGCRGSVWRPGRLGASGAHLSLWVGAHGAQDAKTRA